MRFEVGFYVLLVIVALLGPLPVVAGEVPGYKDIRAACEDDVTRLCSWRQIAYAVAGNYNPVNSCLHINHLKISASCHGVLHRYGYL